MTRAVIVLTALGLLAAAGRAEAACTVSATAVAFGTYDVFQLTSVDSTGTITYRCGNSDHNIRITISSGASGTYAYRILKSGSQVLLYNLFYGGFTQVWGDGSGGTATYFENNPPNKDVVLTVYGRIPASQDVAVGAYTDTVVVTVEY